MNNNLKILGLKADGIRKLTAVEMEFAESGTIQIKGKNRQGKTTIIDTIHWLIEGNKVINDKIVNPDKEKAEGELRLNGYTIKRVYGKTPKLEVRNTENGKPMKGEVQNFLNTFINELTFNPRPFLDKTPYQMLQFALDLFKDKLDEKSKEILGEGFDKIDSKIEELEQERLIVGREVKSFGDIELPEKVEPVSIVKLTEERKAIEERNKIKLDAWEEKKSEELKEIEEFNRQQREQAKAIEVEEDRLNDVKRDIEYHSKEIKELEEKLRIAKENLAKAKENAEDAEKCLAHLKQNPPLPEKPLTTSIPKPELESTEEIDRKISEAGAINERADAYNRALEKKRQKEAKQTEYEYYNEKIKELRDKKLEILRSIDTGVKGLEIREDGLYYNGVYCENWSDAEGLTISSELCIAQKPQLSAIFLDRAESLDSDSLRALDQWAKENDIQCFVTIVDDVPEELEDGVFYIEEGKIITAEKKKVA